MRRTTEVRPLDQRRGQPRVLFEQRVVQFLRPRLPIRIGLEPAGGDLVVQSHQRRGDRRGLRGRSLDRQSGGGEEVVQVIRGLAVLGQTGRQFAEDHRVVRGDHRGDADQFAVDRGLLAPLPTAGEQPGEPRDDEVQFPLVRGEVEPGRVALERRPVPLLGVVVRRPVVAQRDLHEPDRVATDVRGGVAFQHVQTEPDCGVVEPRVGGEVTQCERHAAGVAAGVGGASQRGEVRRRQSPDHPTGGAANQPVRVGEVLRDGADRGGEGGFGGVRHPRERFERRPADAGRVVRQQRHERAGVRGGRLADRVRPSRPAPAPRLPGPRRRTAARSPADRRTFPSGSRSPAPAGRPAATDPTPPPAAVRGRVREPAVPNSPGSTTTAVAGR